MFWQIHGAHAGAVSTPLTLSPVSPFRPSHPPPPRAALPHGAYAGAVGGAGEPANSGPGEAVAGTTTEYIFFFFSLFFFQFGPHFFASAHRRRRHRAVPRGLHHAAR